LVPWRLISINTFFSSLAKACLSLAAASVGEVTGQDGMGGMAMMAGHVEGRLAFLKTELKITDAQLPLWNAVADAIRANAETMGAMSDGMMGSAQSATLPEKLALREK
jgi:LTXXQ motif family protein